MSYLPNEHKIYFLSSSEKPEEIRYTGKRKTAGGFLWNYKN